MLSSIPSSLLQNTQLSNIRPLQLFHNPYLNRGSSLFISSSLYPGISTCIRNYFPSPPPKQHRLHTSQIKGTHSSQNAGGLSHPLLWDSSLIFLSLPHILNISHHHHLTKKRNPWWPLQIRGVRRSFPSTTGPLVSSCPLLLSLKFLLFIILANCLHADHSLCLLETASRTTFNRPCCFHPPHAVTTITTHTYTSSPRSSSQLLPPHGRTAERHHLSQTTTFRTGHPPLHHSIAITYSPPFASPHVVVDSEFQAWETYCERPHSKHILGDRRDCPWSSSGSHSVPQFLPAIQINIGISEHRVVFFSGQTYSHH